MLNIFANLPIKIGLIFRQLSRHCVNQGKRFRSFGGCDNFPLFHQLHPGPQAKFKLKPGVCCAAVDKEVISINTISTSIISTLFIISTPKSVQNRVFINHFVLLYLNFAPFFIVFYGISIISTFDYFNYPRSHLVEIIELLLYIPTQVS
jgi:hypothetical protein